MFRKQTFEDNIYMRIIRVIYIFLAINIGIFLTNIPFFLSSTLLQISFQNYLPFVISLIPLGTSMVVSLAVIDELKSSRDVEPFRAYFKYFKQFWKVGLFSNLLFIIIFTILTADGIFFSKINNGQWIIPLFLLIGVLSLGVLVNVYYFIIKNPQKKIKFLCKATIYFSLRKWYFTLVNFLLIVTMLLCMMLKPQFGFLVTPSIFLGLIYLNCSQLMKSK